jgi:hypothetical protein
VASSPSRQRHRRGSTPLRVFPLVPTPPLHRAISAAASCAPSPTASHGRATIP